MERIAASIRNFDGENFKRGILNEFYKLQTDQSYIDSPLPSDLANTHAHLGYDERTSSRD